jgi:uncharacterized repeat protein (TIGR03803 family)
MLRSFAMAHRLLVNCATACAMVAVLGSAGASASEKVLHSFQGGNDGRMPNGSLIADGSGNLYGVTFKGGSGGGVVFKLAPNGAETVLYDFPPGGGQGAIPNGPLLADNAGNLYGTACCGSDQAGVIFKLTAGGTESVLYNFTGGSDGEYPQGGVIADANGNLYGTAEGGGSDGCGTVFELQTNGQLIVLHAFQGEDGCQPRGTLMTDGSGNLYGTTADGGNMEGCGGSGCGTVFKVAPGGTETVLYAFTGSDGDTPFGGVIADGAGNLYGTTVFGGTMGVGTIFELMPDGTETVLHSFHLSGGDGADPEAGLIMDKSGNLYGTTSDGGGYCKEGCGTAFKLTPGGTESILYTFRPGHGSHPTAALLAGKNGLLYGTTTHGGGDGYGVVFSIHK